ncbi:hypothetical protein E3N88_20218 [Mikania micrantha]|uniref:Uncharacterized protein n=1 Tax=Mikania micrantha TaxID=192012 RepID=A0A5N6NIZ9_9ASTR|nr:hypothetical protein E3N88_20218 [Mikania micrantha]
MIGIFFTGENPSSRVPTRVSWRNGRRRWRSAITSGAEGLAEMWRRESSDLIERSFLFQKYKNTLSLPKVKTLTEQFPSPTAAESLHHSVLIILRRSPPHQSTRSDLAPPPTAKPIVTDLAPPPTAATTGSASSRRPPPSASSYFDKSRRQVIGMKFVDIT